MPLLERLYSITKRKGHTGMNVTTKGPTSNKYNKPTKDQQKKQLDQIQKQLEELYKKHHPGSTLQTGKAN
jgi:hypothetical protein